MFGDSNTRPLLLPIVYDLANLVREGFLRSDKYQEHEKQNRHQFLRRSFEVDPKSLVKEVDFSAPSSSMRDERLQVEDIDEPRVKSVGENFDSLKPEALMMVLNKSRETSTDKTMSFKLPRVHTSQANQTKSISMEEIENLAFSGINGTSMETISDVNGTNLSPMPLIGRYRKKSQPQYKNTGPFPETCERFTGGLCLNVKNYPMNEIMGSIRRHRHAMEALLAEYRDKTAELEKLDYLGDPTSDLSDLR